MMLLGAAMDVEEEFGDNFFVIGPVIGLVDDHSARVMVEVSQDSLLEVC